MKRYFIAGLFFFSVCILQGQSVWIIGNTDLNKIINERTYQLQTKGQALEAAINTAQTLQYQQQALKSLSSADLEGFADFMFLQSKATGSLNSAVTNYKTHKLLTEYAGQNIKHDDDLYYRAVREGKTAQRESAFGQELEDIGDLEWQTGTLLTDVSLYQDKTDRRRQQMRDAQHNGGEVSQLQTTSNLLQIVADQNEDTIRLLYTANMTEAKAKQLKQQKEEYEKAEARIQTSRAAEMPQGFGKGIFGDGNIDIQSQTEERLRAYAQQGERGL